MRTYEHKDISYPEVEIELLNNIDKNFAEKLKGIIANLKEDGACVYNANFTAKAVGGDCVEGFVICQGNAYPGAIRHCWNKIGDDHFDLTKEFVWAKTRPSATFYYFPLEIFEPGVYAGDYTFRSKAVEIAKGVDESVNTEAKAMGSYNYINFVYVD